MNDLRKWLTEQRIYFMKSTHSTYVPMNQEKYLLDTVVRQWPDLNGEVLPMAPGEAARVELKRHIGNIDRVGWRGKDVKLFSWRWPMFCLERFSGQATYIDLRAAYWQIYKKLTLNCKFPNRQGDMRLSPVAHALENWKMARNSVIGVCSHRKAMAVKDGRNITISTKNQFLSPHLWATVQAILNELANLAEQYGAFYCVSDGWFFPRSELTEKFLAEIDILGFNYRRINGYCEVRGWQSYYFENHKTTDLYKRNLNGGRLFRAVRLQNPWRHLNVTKYWSFVLED